MSLNAPSRASRLDPAWLDAEYDQRARHPEHVEIGARWETASSLVQRLESWRRDVRYGPGTNETLDIYPTPAANAPVLVFIHGGYWRSSDKSLHGFLAPAFNADGALVMIPNYALCPAVGIEHIALQLARCLAWVHRHAALYGGDPSRIVVAGHSAGAHLAALMLSCRWKDVDASLPAQLVSGALAVSGLFDLEPLRLAPFIRDDIRLTPASVKRLSPAFFPRPRKPLHTAVGGEETSELKRQAALIRDQWGPTSVPVSETIPHANHFTILHNLADPNGRLHRSALALLGL
ncbi:MAG: alpha/beta hydrolase [Burkholderiaceae bacterium]